MGIHLVVSLGPVVRERAGLEQRRLRLETEATTLGEFVRSLGLTDLSDHLMVVINHQMAIDDHTRLSDGDHVGLYLPLEGG